MKFFLGIHEPEHMRRTSVPTFISRRRLQRRKTLPIPGGQWALDSGGFSELTKFGKWVLTPAEYVALVQCYRREMPGMAFAAPQDWMVEDVMLKRTGLTVAEHQRLTVENYLELRTLDAHLPFIPVLQGQSLDQYRIHADLYASHGVHLDTLPLVGLGSVCRRQQTSEIVSIVDGLADDGFNLHGFGMKVIGLNFVGARLKSADSMAWSHQAHKKKIRLESCTHVAVDCHCCLTWALTWRERVLQTALSGKRVTSLP